MSRFGLALIVAILAYSVSGVTTLVFTEPCEAFEVQSVPDTACPPTCVTCGCCAQPTEVAKPALAGEPSFARAVVVPFAPLLPDTEPGDILHVPRGAAL